MGFSSLIGHPQPFRFFFPGSYVLGKWERITFSRRETVWPGFRPSAQLSFIKGNKSRTSTARAAALEVLNPLGSGPWLSLTAAAFFFFFFFFFFKFFSTSKFYRHW
eukprot:FR743036.1.p1 GENE.FR743036.1~~FR743036.1.p1  ORF type:complete len:106 (-),score=35.20 FR743036.1:408-725(-)